MAELLEKDAKVADSSPADKGAKDAGSPPAEELIAENKRKAEKIEKLTERLEELEEKERSRELTAKEERERASLETDVKKEAAKLRSAKETQPWIEVAREEAKTESEKTAFDVMLNNELERANDFIDDRADEIGKTPKELANELKPFAARYQDKRPSRRNELAFRDWQKEQTKLKTLSEREKAIKDKEDADLKFRERGGRALRDKSLDEKFDGADQKTKMRMMREMVQTQEEVS